MSMSYLVILQLSSVCSWSVRFKKRDCHAKKEI